MKNYKIKSITTALLLTGVFTGAIQVPLASGQTVTEALSSGDVSAQFRLRHESVSQDNALKDADALTLRSMLQYETGAVNGFSALLQFEDVRVVAGVDDYSVPPAGFNTGIYSVIADPESTELNQGFVQYKKDALTIKAGRQVISYDNQRFLGAVGWRQDWQVFDAFSVAYVPNDKLKLDYNFIDQRNRIFSDAADIESNDHLFHGSYASSIGSIVAYAYLLEVDQAIKNSHDTYGLRLTGSTKLGELDASYLAEYATQESESGTNSFDANYAVIESGLTFNNITAKLGVEVLGSDDGSYGFSTPLATGHAFNGWADLFLGTPLQGLRDLYLNIGWKFFGGTASAIFHDFEADNTTAVNDDFGREIDFQFIKAISDIYTAGIKYSKYNKGDIAGKPDTDKLWLWLQASF